MSGRTAARIAWSLWAATLALVAGGLVLGVAGGPEAPFYAYWVEDALIGPTFATLGALIVSRRPGNVIGWVFLACGTGAGVQMLSGQYATTALQSQAASGGAVAAWLSTLAQLSIVFSALILVMLFPTGRLPSPRWRPLAWTAGAVAAVSVASTALTPGPIEDFSSVRNPFGVEPFAGGWPFSIPPGAGRAWPALSRPSSLWCCGSTGPAARRGCSSSGSPTRPRWGSWRSCSAAKPG